MADRFAVGFVGLGTMGDPMCRNILNKSGEPVYVYDIDPGKMESLADAGAVGCTGIGEVAARADLIFIMVPEDSHVTAVISELLPELRTGSIIVDMSTISPGGSRELAARVSAAGAIMLDAPVVKSRGAAVTGTLGILVGGDEGALERVRPFLLMMGETITYMGGNGNGLALKLIHNMLVGNIQNGVNEALLLAEAAGLDFDDTVQGIKSGGGQNFYLDVKAESLKNRDWSPKFSVRNMHKDVFLHEAFASELDLDLPGSGRVRQVYREALESLADEDFSATYKVVSSMCRRQPDHD